MNYFNYFSEIEDLFVRRRGKHLLLSPLDWAMMETWLERGVPLFIVLRGIETVFDGFDKNPGPRTIKGLMYCREEVEAQFAEWAAGQAGKSASADETRSASDSEFDPNAVKQHIENAAKLLRSAANVYIREDLERAADRLDELAVTVITDIETIERSLNDIENFLDAALLTNSDKVHLKNMEKATSAELKPYKAGMEKDAYDSTFRLMLLKKLRESDGLPRLSMFYL